MTKEYKITSESCAKMVEGLVCASCGGNLEPFETVDNAGDPTYWPHCPKCQVIDWGVKEEIHKAAAYLVDNMNFVSYRSIDPSEHMYRERQIRGAISTVLNVMAAVDKTKPKVFDANTFGPDEVPAAVTVDEVNYGYSCDVLIDVDGNRNNFRIGWYDYDEEEWMTHSKNHTVTDGMRWSFLPLAIYETNPELRKTVKI